jgi:KipI family sensor histidine kinase inhibitor
MRIERIGERAYRVTQLEVEPWRMALAVRRTVSAEVAEAVAGPADLGLFLYAAGVSVEELLAIPPAEPTEGRIWTLPVCFDGEDLADVAHRVSRSIDEVREDLARADLRCVAVGFRPGFPYLEALPEAYTKVTRRDSPRTQVPAGAVAIAGRRVGVYPQGGPGGWNLVGSSAARWSPDLDWPAPGDRVRLVRVESLTPGAAWRESI